MIDLRKIFDLRTIFAVPKNFLKSKIYCSRKNTDNTKRICILLLWSHTLTRWTPIKVATASASKEAWHHQAQHTALSCNIFCWKFLKVTIITITKNSHYKEFAKFISESFPLVSLQQIVSDPKCSVIFMRVICKLKTVLSTFNCFSFSPISF